MKDLDYGKDYNWRKNDVGSEKKLSFSPEKLRNRKYYKS